MAQNILQQSIKWIQGNRRGMFVGAIVGLGVAAYYISTHPDINFLMSTSRGASEGILDNLLSASDSRTIAFTKVTIVLTALMGLIGGLIESIKK